MRRNQRKRGLFLEPYWTGSHASFGQTLENWSSIDWSFQTLPGNHWKWRMREAPLLFSSRLEATTEPPSDILLASSYVPLAELYGLSPSEFRRPPSVLYFHENQLTYPISRETPGGKDFHYGFTQAVSARSANLCVFNSSYNRDSFLEELQRLLSRLPSPRPKNLVSSIEAKSRVLGVPLDLPSPLPPPKSHSHSSSHAADGPLIVWPHRWERDKNPESFFQALRSLDQKDIPFRLLVCGGTAIHPDMKLSFEEWRQRWEDRSVGWGFVEDRRDYLSLLRASHIAVSTAEHEFFGVAMMEAAALGCYPLVPDGLSYRELYPERHRFSNQNDLVERLVALCRAWQRGSLSPRSAHTELATPYFADTLVPRYDALFEELMESPRKTPEI